MSVVSYINHQGGVSSKRLLFWQSAFWNGLSSTCARWGQHTCRQTEPRSGYVISEQCPLRSGLLHPQVVQKIWKTFGKAESRPFRLQRQLSLPNLYSKDGAHDWPNLLLYAFSPIALLPQVVRRIREQGHKVLLVAPLWRNQPWLSSLRRTEQYGTLDPSCGLSTFGRSREPTGLPERVLNTILRLEPRLQDASTPLSGLFLHLVPQPWWKPSTSELAVVLSFLQELLDKGRSHSTLKVFRSSYSGLSCPYSGPVGRQRQLSCPFSEGRPGGWIHLGPLLSLHGTCPLYWGPWKALLWAATVYEPPVTFAEKLLCY